jgi:hypothetical protein
VIICANAPFRLQYVFTNPWFVFVIRDVSQLMLRMSGNRWDPPTPIPALAGAVRLRPPMVGDGPLCPSTGWGAAITTSNTIPAWAVAKQMSPPPQKIWHRSVALAKIHIWKVCLYPVPDPTFVRMLWKLCQTIFSVNSTELSPCTILHFYDREIYGTVINILYRHR